MFFLLEDSTNLREASVTYVSERLASQLNIKKKQLKNSLPQLLKHGIDEDKWKSLQGKWRNKESIRFNTSITPPGSAGSKLDIRLTPVKKQEDQKWMWEGECYNPVDGPSADPRELTNILFEQLFDNLPSAAVLLDFETNRVRMINKGFTELFGYQEEEVVNANIDELVVPENQNPISQLNLYRKGQTSSFSVEARRKNKSGEPIDVLLTAAPVAYNGVVQHMFVLYMDITETQKLQERLREQKQFAESIIENLPDTFYMFDEDLNAILWNRNVNDITGCKDLEIENYSPLDFIVERDWEKAEKAIKKAFEEGRATLESEMITKDGDTIPYHFTGKRFVYREKPCVMVYGTDVSEIKKIENQLREANQDKKVLLEEIHHRVKNNLAHISGILELQSYNTQSEEAYTVLQDSQSRVQSIAMIHDQLYQHESFKKVRLDQYIERLTKTIERTWETDDTDIDYHLEADPISLPVKEAVPCGSLINELITNATKHAFKEKQKGNIWVELRKVDQMVKLRVEDDGSGLPDDFSIESEDTLGVNLINNFARQLDGELSYETGDGTSFTVLFKHPEEVEN